jgi:valyl-tRNA synthetase
MTEMEKNYDPKSIEARWYARWIEMGCFHGDATRGGDPYCIVIPPPNVTGILHMGHALNNTIQDILVRWRRMEGRNVVWMPGTDHAGIATQNVVEKALRKEGKNRQDLGREAFVERTWEWQRQYGSTIIGQLKRLGCSCDWDRERFTMDDGLSDAVAEVFVRLYEKGLVYRANYIINWCPRCHTALSDEESEHQDTRGHLYHIRYPVRRRDGKPGNRTHIVVATTRPETLLGDTAVAISPKDNRYRDLAEYEVVLPVIGRVLRVVEDPFVDPAFGTGVVKVTPAHDPNDFQMGQRHNLECVNVMNGDGTMNESAGPYAGMDRFACRKRILVDLEAAGLVEKTEDHQHAVGHCYRCDTVVEPRLSLQWFVRMKPLAAPAIEAVRDGRITFVPDRWTKVYLEWMENIRDWCISRQIWWGHRIPVFYCDTCGKEWAAKGRPQGCPACGATKFHQDEDVLDTWFSSWLWPFSTFGWPRENGDLKFFYPTHDMVTASEIIFFWVARMIMAGFEFMGDLPFRTVYIHGTVRDAKGRKMSKSLGNSIDPLTIIDAFSADALRFSLTMLTATGQDVYISNDKFEVGRNFGTKLWNAARFIRMNSEGFIPPPQASFDAAALGPDDKHLLSKLQDAVAACTDNLGRYRFNEAALSLYEFVWHQFCDWYVEASKNALNSGDPARREQTLRVLHYAFDRSLRLLHPFMPFVTEELWHAMGYGGEGETIMLAKWPVSETAEKLAAWGCDAGTVAYVDRKRELIRAGRTLRADYEIPPAQRIDYVVKPASADESARLTGDVENLKLLLRAGNIRFDESFQPGRAMPGAVTEIGTIFMPLEGLVDADAEKKRLEGQIEKARGELQRVVAKLSNEQFVGKAPPEVVEQQRAKQRESEENIAKLQRLLDGLKAGG